MALAGRQMEMKVRRTASLRARLSMAHRAPKLQSRDREGAVGRPNFATGPLVPRFEGQSEEVVAKFADPLARARGSVWRLRVCAALQSRDREGAGMALRHSGAGFPARSRLSSRLDPQECGSAA